VCASNAATRSVVLALKQRTYMSSEPVTTHCFRTMKRAERTGWFSATSNVFTSAAVA
jgi:hypothetical protein